MSGSDLWTPELTMHERESDEKKEWVIELRKLVMIQRDELAALRYAFDEMTRDRDRWLMAKMRLERRLLAVEKAVDSRFDDEREKEAQNG